jgi:hypothetical protein
MAEEKKELSEEEKKAVEAKEREDMRQIQLGVLKSSSLINLVVASAGKDVSNYGEMGKLATQENYLQALSDPDKSVSQIMAMPYLQSAMNAQKNNLDMYEEGFSATPSMLFRNAQAIYQGALTKVKVSDILGMVGIKEVHGANISDEDKNMYMEDYMKKNKDTAGKLLGRYLGAVQNQGVAKSIMEYDARQTKGLEEILKEAPKPKEEKKEEKK